MLSIEVQCTGVLGDYSAAEDKRGSASGSAACRMWPCKNSQFSSRDGSNSLTLCNYSSSSFITGRHQPWDLSENEGARAEGVVFKNHQLMLMPQTEQPSKSWELQRKWIVQKAISSHMGFFQKEYFPKNLSWWRTVDQKITGGEKIELVVWCHCTLISNFFMKSNFFHFLYIIMPLKLTWHHSFMGAWMSIHLCPLLDKWLSWHTIVSASMDNLYQRKVVKYLYPAEVSVKT